MLRTKYFWRILFVVVPFLAIWIMEGFGWALATLFVTPIIFMFIRSEPRRRRRRYFYEDEEPIERRPRSRNVFSIGSDSQLNNRKSPCPECGGSGRVAWGSKASGMPLITRGAPGSSKYVRCPVCHGSGKV